MLGGQRPVRTAPKPDEGEEEEPAVGLEQDEKSDQPT